MKSNILAGILIAILSPVIANAVPMITSFSVDPASVAINGNISPDDVLNAGPVVFLEGIDLGLDIFDNLDALSFGQDPVTRPCNKIPVYFSVNRLSVGLPGSDVYDQAQAGSDEAAGDAYRSLPPDGSNKLAIDEEQLGLTPGYFGDDIDALELNSEPSPYTYFSIDSLSASNDFGSLSYSNDIYLNFFDPLNPFAFGEAHMGLNQDDDVDALALWDVFNPGHLDPGIDLALFSISTFSPSAITMGGSFSPADILFTDFNGTFSLWASATEIGLDPFDEVDALDTVPEPSTIVLMAGGLLFFVFMRHRKRINKKFSRLFILLLLLFIGLGVDARADMVLQGQSPPIPGSSATLWIGINELTWSSSDNITGVIDTGLATPGTWRQLTPDSLLFILQSGTLRLYGQVRTSRDATTAIVDILYNGKRARYLLTELPSVSGGDGEEPYYPPYPPEEAPTILKGRVYASGTGAAMSGAIVALAGCSQTTGADGAYQLSDISAGSHELVVSKEGFNNYSENLVIEEQTTTVRNVELTAEAIDPDQPVVTAVRSQFEGIFLESISLGNRYDVSVQWNGQPGSVKFDINGNQYVVGGNQAGASRVFDMGLDFNGSVMPDGNRMTIMAVNQAGMESRPKVLHPVVIPVPAWSAALGLWALASGQGQGGFEFGLEANFPEPALEGTITPPKWIPIVGGKKSGLLETQLIFGLAFESSGTGSVYAGGKTGFEVGGNGLSGKLLGTGNLQYKPNSGMIWLDTTASIEIAGTISPPPVPLSDLIVPGSGTIAKLLKPILSAEIKSEFGPVLSAVFLVVEKNGSVTFSPKELGGALDAKIALVLSAGPAEAQLYGGGTSSFTVQFPADPSLLKEIALKLYAGVEVKLWIYSKKVEAAYKWTYPPSAATSFALLIPTSTLPLRDTDFEPVQPTFLDFGPYSIFVQDIAFEGSLRSETVTAGSSGESMVIQNVYPEATPAIAAQNGDQIIAFVYYDPAKAPVQATDIYYTFFDGGSYSEPAAILDDTRAEFNPQLAFDSDGHAMAVWERVKDPGYTSEDIDDMAPLMEIVYALYSPLQGTWTTPSALTDNLILDHAPLLRSDETGRLLLLWEENSGNQFYGEADNPSRIRYAIWDGTAWTPAATALDSVIDAFDFNAAFWTGGGIITWSQDCDGDVSTLPDREIYYAELGLAGWSAPCALTDDDITDSGPKVVVTGPDSLQLLWRHGNEYVELVDLATGEYKAVRQASGLELDSALLVSAPAGKSYLVWQTLKDDNADIFYRVKNIEYDLWGADTRLTQDDSVEKHVKTAVSPDGTLHLVYTKAETLYETLTVDTSEGPVEVGDVPQPGRTDLFVSSHRTFGDLLLVEGSFTISDSNPFPGMETWLGATIRNSGDEVIDGFRVAFYDGSPLNGGIEIETRTVSDPLSPGASCLVEAPWVAPDDGRVHVLYALADSENAIDESNEENNSAFMYSMLPEVEPIQTSSLWRGQDTLEFVASIANNGQSAAGSVMVDLRKDAPDGKLLNRHILTALERGTQSQVSFTWQPDPDTLQNEEIILYFVTDPYDVILEMNEENNTRSHLVIMP